MEDMEQRTDIRLSTLERSVVVAFLALLVAASAPSVVQMRRAPRENELRVLRNSFAEAVGAIHGRWLMAGGAADHVVLHGLRIAINRQGWPTIDPRYPTQDTALELYHLVMRQQLSHRWTSQEFPARGSGIATYVLSGPGGGSFHYIAATGTVE